MKILALLLFFNMANAEDKTNPPSAQILDHPNNGCPTNAQCSKAAGLKFLKTKELIKNKKWNEINNSIISEGFPLDVWSYQERKSQNTETISWDSPCSLHQQHPQVILLSLAFLKTTTNKDIIPRKTYLYNESKSPTQYLGLREGSPLFSSNLGLHYTREIDGHYYQVNIDSKGKFKILDHYSPKKFPITISCPEHIQEFARKNYKKNLLHQGFYCQKIWNIDKKDFDTILLGQGCF